MARVSMSTSAVAMFPTNHEISTCELKVNIFRSRDGEGTLEKLASQMTTVFVHPQNQFKPTIEGNRFILFDETAIQRKRLLLFTSDNEVDVLFDSLTVFMDGTFSRGPLHFKQIFIYYTQSMSIYVRTNTSIDLSSSSLHLSLKGLSCVFALMVNKKSFTTFVSLTIDRLENLVRAYISTIATKKRSHKSKRASGQAQTIYWF